MQETLAIPTTVPNPTMTIQRDTDRELLERLNKGCSCDLHKMDRCCCAVMDEAADRIAALAARCEELERERDEHLRLKNELVLKAYPAMDARDALASENERLRAALYEIREAMGFNKYFPLDMLARDCRSARRILGGSPVPPDRTLVDLAEDVMRRLKARQPKPKIDYPPDYPGGFDGPTGAE